MACSFCLVRLQGVYTVYTMFFEQTLIKPCGYFATSKATSINNLSKLVTTAHSACIGSILASVCGFGTVSDRTQTFAVEATGWQL